MIYIYFTYMHIPKAVDAEVKMELVRKPSFNSF